jgi:hypothetical protein
MCWTLLTHRPYPNNSTPTHPPNPTQPTHVQHTEAMELSRKALRPTTTIFKDGRETKVDVLRIGIQVRAGDWTFDNEQEEELRFGPYKPFFDCARQLEEFAKPHPESQVMWYLISDSRRLRKRALKRFGAEKLVTLTREHAHVACNVVDCSRHNQTQALLDAVGDLLSLSGTDYQVLTQKSGFGKVAASLATHHWHNVYWPGGYALGFVYCLLTALLAWVFIFNFYCVCVCVCLPLARAVRGRPPIDRDASLSLIPPPLRPRHTDKPIGKGSFHNSKDPRKIVSTVGTCTQADYVLLEDLSDGYVCMCVWVDGWMCIGACLSVCHGVNRSRSQDGSMGALRHPFNTRIPPLPFPPQVERHLTMPITPSIFTVWFLVSSGGDGGCW